MVPCICCKVENSNVFSIRSGPDWKENLLWYRDIETPFLPGSSPPLSGWILPLIISTLLAEFARVGHASHQPARLVGMLLFLGSRRALRANRGFLSTRGAIAAVLSLACAVGCSSLGCWRFEQRHRSRAGENPAAAERKRARKANSLYPREQSSNRKRSMAVWLESARWPIRSALKKCSQERLRPERFRRF